MKHARSLLLSIALVAAASPAIACRTPDFQISSDRFQRSASFGQSQVKVRFEDGLILRQSSGQKVLALRGVIVEGNAEHQVGETITLLMPIDERRGCMEFYDPGAVMADGRLSGFVVLHPTDLAGVFMTGMSSDASKYVFGRQRNRAKWGPIRFDGQPE